MIIRPLQASDYPHIVKMWESQYETPPSLEAMPHESTFVLDVEGVPIAVLSVILTNCKLYALLENFVADPIFRGKARHDGVRALIQYAENFASALKYKKSLCLAPSPSLKRLYRKYGYSPTLSGVTTMIKNL